MFWVTGIARAAPAALTYDPDLSNLLLAPTGSVTADTESTRMGASSACPDDYAHTRRLINTCSMLTHCIGIIALVVIMSSTETHAQTFVDGSDEGVSASELTLDLESKPSAYAAEYHFGDSEWESTLKLTVRNSTVTGVLTYGVWSNSAKNWKSKTIRFTGTISGNMLLAKDWKGVFVRRGDRRGVLLIEAGRDQNVREFGYRM